MDDGRDSEPDSKAQAIPTTTEIQRSLPPDTALIEYVVGRQTISILVITRLSVIGLPVSIASGSLSSRTELLRDLIMARRSEWIQPARGLYTLLLRPVQSTGYLKGIRQLLIVPDGVLNYVPFAALPTSRSRFLGDEYTVAYLPSAVALVTESAGRSNGRKLLAMAPSGTHLPNAAGEVRGIGQIFPRTARVVVGNERPKPYSSGRRVIMTTCTLQPMEASTTMLRHCLHLNSNPTGKTMGVLSSMRL